MTSPTRAPSTQLLVRVGLGLAVGLLSIASCSDDEASGDSTSTETGTSTTTASGTDTGTGTCVYTEATDCPTTLPVPGSDCPTPNTYCWIDAVCGNFPSTSSVQVVCESDSKWTEPDQFASFVSCSGAGTMVGSPGPEPCPCFEPMEGDPCGMDSQWMGVDGPCKYDADPCNSYVCDGCAGEFDCLQGGTWLKVDFCAGTDTSTASGTGTGT